MIGVILAAGYSKRLRPLGISQKAVVPVKWKGVVAPLIVHQIRELAKVVDGITVVAGHNFGEVMHEAFFNTPNVGATVDMFADEMIRGQGWAWKQVVEIMNPDEIFLSLNVDDLHENLGQLKRHLTREGVSVTYRQDMPKDYARYELDKGGRILSLDRNGGNGYFGTGIYILKRSSVELVQPPPLGVEFGADMVVVQLLEEKIPLRALFVDGWHDCGNVKGMKAIMSDGWRKK